MRKLRPLLGVFLCCLVIVFCFTPQIQTILDLPHNQRMVVGEANSVKFDLPANLQEKLEMKVMGPSRSVFALQEDPPVSVIRNASGYEILALKPGKANIRINLFGYIPIKSMEIVSLPTKRVVVGGHSIGVLLQSQGIMIVGYAPVTDDDGTKHYPGKEQGIEIGDLILQIDNQPVSRETDLATIIDGKNGKSMNIGIKRRGKNITLPVKPLHCSETERYRIGLYVRDGVVGVGTLTFWEPDTRQYAALGHIIVDADTKQGINVLKGRVVSASIQTIKPGRPGRPGEKIGVFNDKNKLSGNIVKNSNYGIFGQTDSDITNPIIDLSMEVGYAHQVKKGPAQIFTVVNGEDIEKFDIDIEKVYPDRQNGKGMVIKVTDPRLLSVTGGIVQGMSGSPIVQNNRIVGAVTHVFLNDPQSGYGVFMDNILSEMPNSITNWKKVSTNY